MSYHWGEYEHTSIDYNIPDVTPDIEKSMDELCLNQYETEYDDIETPIYEHVCFKPADPLIRHAIALHKYANDIIEKIRLAEVVIESHVMPPQDVAPPLPEMPKVEIKHKRNKLNYIPKEFPFHPEDDVPEISDSVAKQAVTKAVATLFAHIGYESTHQSVLDFMADIMETFLKTFTRKLKRAFEDEANGLSTDFPDVAERVLVEVGLGGCRGLHDYYQSRVIKYIDVLRKRCKDLSEYYEKILIPREPSPNDDINNIVRVKVEEDDVLEVDNPEINLSNMDIEYELSSLETGFQLLNSLEAEENLQGIEEEASSPSEVDLQAGNSPYSKKKRTK